MRAALFRLVRFILTGAVGTAVYMGLYLGLTGYIGLWYIASSLVAFTVGVSLTLVGHRFWTFKNREEGTLKRQGGEYFTLRTLLLLPKTVLLYFTVEHWHVPESFAPLVADFVLFPLGFYFSLKIFRLRNGNGPSTKAAT